MYKGTSWPLVTEIRGHAQCKPGCLGVKSRPAVTSLLILHHCPWGAYNHMSQPSGQLNMGSPVFSSQVSLVFISSTMIV